MFLVTEQWAGDYGFLISQMGTYAIHFLLLGHIKGKTVYSSNYPETEGKLSEYSVQFQQHNFDLQ